jgi:(1->4)-alpha-D-glucan 1-alpha-D-glucosylmutase
MAAGRINSLAQTLLKCTAPGVPDTYQGSELWDLHLVDPDNRGVVDYEERAARLAELEAGLSVEEILAKIDTGMPKLWTLHTALNLRNRSSEHFGSRSSYTPLDIEGKKKDHVIGYLRGGKVATIVPRWNLKLAGNWSGTSVVLPAGRWRNLLTGEELVGGNVSIQAVLKRFPVALLVSEEN